MEYHNDRFTDASVIIYDEKGKITALLPANISGDTVFSHGGLTYGGVLTASGTDVMTVCEIFTAIRRFYSAKGASCGTPYNHEGAGMSHFVIV